MAKKQQTAVTAESQLPLAPATFEILLALVDGERHGYSIMKEVTSRTDGAVRMGPGTLYGALKRLLEGVYLADGRVRAKRIKRLKHQGQSTWLKVVLSEGKNREIRRMLAKLGHKVLRLRRTAIGPVQLDRLPKGKARRLSGPELQALQRSVERRGQPKTQS